MRHQEPYDSPPPLRAENLAALPATAPRGKALFRNINFQLMPGERMDILGPNGSGKTTLLAILAGISEPSRGTVLYEGALHYVGHENALSLSLSCEENLGFWGEIYRARQKEEKARQALAFAGLLSLRESAAASLSAGQKRRLALARLLMADRPLWVLDEAEASLDAEARQNLRELISRHLKRGGMAIAAIHEKRTLLATSHSAKRIFLGGGEGGA